METRHGRSGVFTSPTFTGQSTFADGTAAAPSISFTNDPNTGIFRGADERISFATNGASNTLLDTNGFSSINYRLGATPDAPDVGLSRNAASIAEINNGNAGTLTDLAARGVINGPTKTLTEGGATAFVDIAVAASAAIGGELYIVVEAKDATNTQARILTVPFTAVATAAGVVTSTLGTPVEVVTVSAGTLTCTLTITNGAGKITINANATSSLTQTTLQAKWKIVSPSALTITTV